MSIRISQFYRRQFLPMLINRHILIAYHAVMHDNVYFSDENEPKIYFPSLLVTYRVLTTGMLPHVATLISGSLGGILSFVR